MDHVTAEGLACFVRCPRAYYELHVDGSPARLEHADAAAPSGRHALRDAMLRALVPERPGPAPPWRTLRNRLARDLADLRLPSPARREILGSFDAFWRARAPFPPAASASRDLVVRLELSEASAGIVHRLDGIVRDRDGWRIERVDEDARTGDPAAAIEAALDAWGGETVLATRGEAGPIRRSRHRVPGGDAPPDPSASPEPRSSRETIAAVLRDALSRRGRAAFEPRPSERCRSCAARMRCPARPSPTGDAEGAETPRISSRSGPAPSREAADGPDSSAG